MGIWLFPIFFLLGALSLKKESSVKSVTCADHQFEKIRALAKITKPMGENQNSYRYKIKFQSIWHKDHWESRYFSGILYLKKEEGNPYLLHDDIIIGDFSLVDIEKPKNPLEFNQQEYYQKIGLGHRVFADQSGIKIISRTQSFNLLRWSQSIRKGLEEIFAIEIPDSELRNTIFAITLGQKEGLSEEIKTTYRKAGAAHLLAVSGLHMGIIYLLISWILSPLKRMKTGPPIISILIILLLFLYSFITGFSPSALRAAIMLSTYEIGSLSKRQNSSWNSLGVAALIICIFDPYSIFDAGFQLSFFAMAGIFFFYPWLTKKCHFRNLLVKNVWKILVLSISVTLTTSPLVLFYFGQIYLYGLLTNLFSGLGATIAISLFFAGMVSYPLSSKLFGMVSNGLEYFMSSFNQLLSFIGRLPGNSFNPLEVDFFMVITICFILLILMALIEYRKPAFLLLFLGGISTLIAVDIYREVSAEKQNMLVFFSNNKGPLIARLKAKRSAFFFSDSSLIENGAFIYDNFLRAHRVKNQQFNEIERAGKAVIIEIEKKRIWFPGSSSEHKIGEVDYIYFEIKPKIEIIEQLPKFKGRIIVDQYFYGKNDLLAVLDSNNIHYHDLQKGYFLEYL